MAKIYARRIKAGLMALEDVPAIWRAKTAALLQEEENV
mgnify:FL=1